jgi:type IV pilus assembly protein PilV
MSEPRRINASAAARGARGFSLIEVLISLIIIGIGLLGIAKIQALAYASTGTASLRSLAAIEASSLASAMRANRGYWTVAPTPLTITITGATVAASDATLLGANNCTLGVGATPCAFSVLAGYDLRTWATALNAALPGVNGTVSCPTPVTVGNPIGCTIQINWIERTTGINAQSNTTGTSTMALPTYTLYVEP